MEEITHGLLLQTFPYLGRKKILKILSPEQGLLSFMATIHAAPFCIGEFVYRKNSKDLYPLKDFTLLDPLLELKTSYDTLHYAGIIAQDLLRTQMPHKKAPYSLACAFLKKLPLNPEALSASFRLKLLLHEGLLSPEDPLSSEEQVLAFSPTFSQIIALKNIPTEKIAELFKERT